ncbi:hypothetical protein WDZ92_29855 [Nostoc sp. NIES-2111]
MHGEAVPGDIVVGDLAETIAAELASKNAVIIGRGEIGAWARKPG